MKDKTKDNNDKLERRRLYFKTHTWEVLEKESTLNSTSPSIEAEKAIEEKFNERT